MKNYIILIKTDLSGFVVTMHSGLLFRTCHRALWQQTSSKPVSIPDYILLHIGKYGKTPVQRYMKYIEIFKYLKHINLLHGAPKAKIMFPLNISLYVTVFIYFILNTSEMAKHPTSISTFFHHKFLISYYQLKMAIDKMTKTLSSTCIAYFICFRIIFHSRPPQSIHRVGPRRSYFSKSLAGLT